MNAILNGLWGKGIASRPSLEPDALIAKAGAVSVPDRSGWRGRLELLCADLARDARLTPLGRTLAHGQLVAGLRHRVRAEALWAERPEILERPVAPPIVIVGQMRSGSTRLQRLLACDPRLAATRFYESWNPVPRSALPLFDDRAWRSRFALAASRLLNPDFDRIHPTRWNAPDEEIGWHSIAVFGASFEAQWRVPRFTAAIETEDALPVYCEFRRFLQTVAHLRGGDDASKRWVLKVPQFTQDLPAILRVFRGATLIRLDRDPVAVVGSSASLVRNQMAIQSNAVCPDWIGRETLRKVALRHRRTEDALAGADANILRLDYAAMSDDWQREMARVYRTLELPLTAAARARMTSFVGSSERGAHAGHRYALADYGLSASEVRAAIA